MNPSEFVQLGYRLGDGSTEAEWRTAVSRMYYGAFHTACELLIKCGVTIPTHQARTKVPHCLSMATHIGAKMAGKDLQTLREMRRIADYELDNREPMDIGWAQDQKAFTQQIMDSLAEWSADTTFQTSAESIRKYAREVLKLPVSEP
jgi:uncharacterized protein (UPF0332 family)